MSEPLTMSEAVERSYELMALLTITERAVRHLETETDGPEAFQGEAWAVALCLEMANRFARETHDAFEKAAVQWRGKEAS